MYAAISAAPSSVVAVPPTLAPERASASAIALPMPRVAPVTSAVCPSSIFSPVTPACSAAVSRGGNGGSDRLAVVQRQRGQVGRDAPGQTGPALARPARADTRPPLCHGPP